ncbi:hypothetical protein L596_003615 [Steinernema carpocapsae]|nr:hypothetical protein L596_003615 [Steinernema carpocapsae]
MRINAAANNASPLLMSTLHLSGFSNASAQTFLPSATSQIALGGQFPADLANVASAAWTTQPQPWFDQAKVAAMLPMYGMLPQSVTAVSDSRMFNNQASKSFLPSVSVGFEQPERFSTASTSQASQSLGQCSSTPSSASFDSRASPQRPCRVSSRVSSITVNSPSMVSSHPKTSTTTSSHPPSNERLVRCSPMVATSQANSSLPMTPACTLVNSPSTSKSLEKTATEATVTPSVPGSVANGPDAATPSEQPADIESIFTNDGDAHTAVPNMNASGHFTFDHHPHPSTSHLTAGGSTMNGGIDHSTFDDLSWTKDINLDDFHLNYDSTADFHALLSSDLTNELLKTDTSKSKDKFTADDFDKEFERHLNAVANNHAKTTSLPIFDAFSSLLSTDILKKDDKLQEENISLHNPVKFTPPDSPCSSIGGDNEDFDDNAASATYNGSAKLKHPKAESMLDMLSFLPKIEAYKQPVKVPVYKQRNHNNVFLFNEKEKEKADEYDFSDDDEKDDSPFTSFFNRDVPKEPVSVLSDKAAAFSGLSQAATALDQSETEVSPQKSQLVESIRKRRELRALSSFLHAESLTDDFETAVTDFVGPSSSQSVIKKEVEAEERSEENNNVPEELPPLPKLYIKIHRKDSVGKTKDKKKKKKKRRKKERDHEWEGSDRPKKKKKKKHKKDRERQDSSSGYEARLVSETESWKPPAAGSGEAPVFSRKRRLMMQWNEAEAEASERNDESRKRLRLSSPARERKEQFEEQWNPHLIKFSQAHGNLAKGTFVVSKHDLVRIENCALWRVDNQNLLQKYPPVVDQKTGKKMYRNSSTYSGWCDQIAGGYLTVATKYMKHSRAESIVEPEIPLADLFPAISEEVEDRMTVAGDSCEKAEEPREVLCFGKDSLRVNLQTYLQAMLNHAFSLSFLQSIKQANEWNYLCSLNEIDKANAEAKARIKERVRWNENFIEMVQQYSFCSSNDSDLSNIPCQACNYDPTSSILQLFSNEFYDYDTLEPKMFLNSGGDSPLPAIEFLVCSGCQQLAVLYHRFHHMRYALLKKCEDKIELVSSENPNYTINEVIETCMKQLNWVRKISEEYLLGWKRVSQV